MRRSDWSSAVQRWQSILDHQPSFPPQVYLRQARALLAAKQFTAALGVVDLALEARPDDPVLVDLKSVIASHKAKKYQVVVQPLQTAPGCTGRSSTASGRLRLWRPFAVIG
ncbi:tetratricopeptide repeat protein [Salinicola acroporae]|uniref:Tetratricopeptide repeat protein n=1 Tax=Salinicola acroporae TaxID=1541440 RepID=A0ABT6I1Z9_9GAMM|nr:tetratricopeptide repeat protein [Salinicola acroporae]MDH4571698.1 hypothetical protein [Salinicola acroporae]